MATALQKLCSTEFPSRHLIIPWPSSGMYSQVKRLSILFVPGCQCPMLKMKVSSCHPYAKKY